MISFVTGGEEGFPTRSTSVANERGIALIITLWIIIVLGVTATYFSRGIREEAYIVRNFKDNEKAQLLAMAGVNHALALLSHPAKDGINVDQRFLSDYFSDIANVALGDGSYHVSVTDEESRININLASRDVIRGLLKGTGSSPAASDSISDAIIDWRDGDDVIMLNGAEDDYYMSLEPPYRSKNSNFLAIEELLLVRGIDEELMYGEKRDGDNTDLASRVTVFGRGKVNINTADEYVLEALPGIDEQSAMFITKGREDIDYTPMSKGEFMQYIRQSNPTDKTSQDYPVLNRTIDTKSYHFRIVSIGRIDGSNVEKRIEAVVYRTILGSRVSLRILSWRELGPEDGVIS